MSTPESAKPRDILQANLMRLERFAVARAPKSGEERIGERVARLRREKGLTQDEMAARLQVTQPVVSDYERGRLRLHGELIVQLTQILGVLADEILGLKTLTTRNGSIQNRRLLRQVQALETLPKRDQQAVIRTIEAFLAKAGWAVWETRERRTL